MFSLLDRKEPYFFIPRKFLLFFSSLFGPVLPPSLGSGGALYADPFAGLGVGRGGGLELKVMDAIPAVGGGPLLLLMALPPPGRLGRPPLLGRGGAPPDRGPEGMPPLGREGRPVVEALGIDAGAGATGAAAGGGGAEAARS
jgi:hypothetical protein